MRDSFRTRRSTGGSSRRVQPLLGAGHLHHPLVDGQDADTVHDGVDPVGLEIHFLVTGDEAEHAQGRLDLDGIAGQKLDGPGFDVALNGAHELLVKVEAAMDGPGIQEDREVAHVVRLRVLEPGDEVLLPGGKGLAPHGIGGHVPSGAPGHPHAVEGVGDGFGPLGRLRGRGDEGVVLVGGDDLLLAAGASHVDPDRILHSGPPARQLDDPGHHPVVDRGDEAADVVEVELQQGQHGDGAVDAGEEDAQLLEGRGLEDPTVEGENRRGGLEVDLHIPPGEDSRHLVVSDQHQVFHPRPGELRQGIEDGGARRDGHHGPRHEGRHPVLAASVQDDPAEVGLGQDAQSVVLLVGDDDGAHLLPLHPGYRLVDRGLLPAGHGIPRHHAVDAEEERRLLEQALVLGHGAERTELPAHEGGEEGGESLVVLEDLAKAGGGNQVAHRLLDGPRRQEVALALQAERPEHLASGEIVQGSLSIEEAHQPRINHVDVIALPAFFEDHRSLGVEVDFQPGHEGAHFLLGQEGKRADLSHELLGWDHGALRKWGGRLCSPKGHGGGRVARPRPWNRYTPNGARVEALDGEAFGGGGLPGQVPST